MKLIILDRDGVINFDSDQYIKSPDEWKPIPGSMQAIARLNQRGYRAQPAAGRPGKLRVSSSEIYRKIGIVLRFVKILG